MATTLLLPGLFFLLFLIQLGPAARAEEAPLRAMALWDVPSLLAQPPAVEYGTTEDLTNQLWYEGAPLAGKLERIFAWLDLPAGKA